MTNSIPIQLYISAPHPCSYLDDHVASSLFIAPDTPMDPFIYSQLAQQGFRRSGDHVYRPHCQDCDACIPVRVPVAHFHPNRQQRRTWKKNQDLTVTITNTPDRNEHLTLFREYVSLRHKGGGMDEMTGDSPFEFFRCSWSDTSFYEFRDQQKLIAVAVVDSLEDSLSAVYSYFTPEMNHRSLGVYMVLWQIQQAQQLGLSYLYLGYLIKDCQKMSYKAHYQPLEQLQNNQWEELF